MLKFIMGKLVYFEHFNVFDGSHPIQNAEIHSCEILLFKNDDRFIAFNVG